MKPRPKLGIGTVPLQSSLHTSPFIDKYVAFLENQGKRFDNLAEFKNNEYFRIQSLRPTMPPISDAELLEATDTYIRVHKMAGLTQAFIYPTPSVFFAHYFDVIRSKEFKQDVADADVERVLSNPQVKKQIEFLLERLTLSWGEKFPPESRVRLLARSFANFDKFCQTEEFLNQPESTKAQFSRFQTVRNFYRYIEQKPQINDIRQSPVMTIGYLSTIVKQHSSNHE